MFRLWRLIGCELRTSSVKTMFRRIVSRSDGSQNGHKRWAEVLTQRETGYRLGYQSLINTEYKGYRHLIHTEQKGYRHLIHTKYKGLLTAFFFSFLSFFFSFFFFFFFFLGGGVLRDGKKDTNAIKNQNMSSVDTAMIPSSASLDLDSVPPRTSRYLAELLTAQPPVVQSSHIPTNAPGAVGASPDIPVF